MSFKNIDLDKYNKRLLAIIGTVAVAGTVIIVLIAVAGTFYNFFSHSFRSDRRAQNNGIVLNQDQVIDTKTHDFHQELSINKPYQLDTIAPVFIVPISQIDQTTKRMEIATAGMAFGSSYYSDDYQYSNFSGLYNNFVLLDYTRNIQKEIFHKKVAITEWAFLKIDTTKLIVLLGTDEDSNKDGRLNDDDFQSLFVFDVNTLKSKVLRFENQTVRSLEPLKLTSKIYVRTGKDLNDDKKFDHIKEPTDLYFYDVRTGEHETLIPTNVKERIQGILNN